MHYGRPEGCVRWQDLQAFERNSAEALDQARLLAWIPKQCTPFRSEAAASFESHVLHGSCGVRLHISL